MCLGLPLRTTNTTTESDDIPFSGFASQFEATILSLTSRVMSGVVENATMSAGWPGVDGAALRARGGERRVEAHALAAGGLSEGVGQRGVGLLRGRVADQRQLGLGRAGAGRTAAAAAGTCRSIGGPATSGHRQR